MRPMNNSLCGYKVAYVDGMNKTGVRDMLTLMPGVAVGNFRFGCGQDQSIPSDKFDGLIGFGGAPESLVSQTAPFLSRAFSYCLPLPPSKIFTDFLALGPPSNLSVFAFTPMQRRFPTATFYVVLLTGLSVGGQHLDIPPSVFMNGMIVDSGTVFTWLPATTYAALRTAFRSAMSAYPPAPLRDELDTYTAT